MKNITKGIAVISLIVVLAGCGKSIAQNGKASESSPAEIAKVDQKNQSELKAEIAKEKNPSPVSEEIVGRRLLSKVDVKLLDGKAELSEFRVGAGQIEFNVRNESIEPLMLSVVKTELDPVKIKVKEGRINRTQEGVEIVSELQDQAVKPGHQGKIVDNLKPGEYKVIVTSPDHLGPVAYSVLTVELL